MRHRCKSRYPCCGEQGWRRASNPVERRRGLEGGEPAQQTTKAIQALKKLAAHKQYMEKKAEKFRAQIADLTNKLEQTEKALALTKDDYDKLHLAMSLDGGQAARKDTVTPQTVNEELADKLICM